MKYIQTFEGHSVNEFIDEIKDYFQELIDDFSLEEVPDDLEEDDETPGIFYDFNTQGSLTGHNKLHIYIWVGEDYVEKFKSMKSSLNQFFDQIKNLGYCIDAIDFDRYAKEIERGYTNDSFDISIWLE